MVVMGKHYKHLTLLDRAEIYRLTKQGCSLKDIADTIGVHKSTVCRERKRNVDEKMDEYHYEVAQKKATQRRIKVGSKILRSKHLQETIKDQLVMGRSPDVIAGRLKLETGKHTISHESIYKWIYEESNDPTLKTLLLRAKRHRGSRPSKKQENTKIAHRRSIHERPDIKGQFGHWEGDTVVFAGHKGCIVTLYERVSKLLLCTKVETKDSTSVGKAIIMLMKDLPEKARKSLTMDNGGEFARHESFHEFLGKDSTYFCDPYSSWQKGGVENVNGILRRYVPKGSKKEDYSNADIELFMCMINDNPRKSLDFKTPYEAFAEQLTF